MLAMATRTQALSVNLNNITTTDAPTQLTENNTSFLIRPLLTLDAAKATAVSTVGSRLNYCNIILHYTSCRRRMSISCVGKRF